MSKKAAEGVTTSPVHEHVLFLLTSCNGLAMLNSTLMVALGLRKNFGRNAMNRLSEKKPIFNPVRKARLSI